MTPDGHFEVKHYGIVLYRSRMIVAVQEKCELARKMLFSAGILGGTIATGGVIFLVARCFGMRLATRRVL